MATVKFTKKSLGSGAEASVELGVDDSIAQDAACIAVMLASALIELQDGKELDDDALDGMIADLKATQRLRIFADHAKIMERQLTIAYDALNDIHEAEDDSAKWQRADQALYRMRLAAQGH